MQSSKKQDCIFVTKSPALFALLAWIRPIESMLFWVSQHWIGFWYYLPLWLRFHLQIWTWLLLQKKKERGNNKATVVPKNLTDRERHTDRQRQRKKEGDKERVWQTKTDCYIGHERTSSKKSTENQSQRICSKIMRRGLRLVRNGKFLRNVTWPWRRKLVKRGKRVKKHRNSKVFGRIDEL